MSGPSEVEFDVIVHPLEGHRFWGEVDGMPGCVTQGSSYTEILARLEDAFAGCATAQESPTPAENGSVSFPEANSISTAGDLRAALESNGWHLSGTTEFHAIFRKGGKEECLPVLLDASEEINEGLLAAIVVIAR